MKVRGGLLTGLLLLGPLPTGAGEAPAPESEPACVACQSEPATLESFYSAGECADLRGGSVLVVEEEREAGAPAGARTTRAAGVIVYPPRIVWQTLTDFESWPGFIPHVVETEIARREGLRMWVTQHFRVLFTRLRHTTIYDLAPIRGELRWKLDPDSPADIASSQGHWQLVALEGGARTLVRYRATMDAGRSVPDFVEEMLMRRSLRSLISSLREEVTRRQGLPDSGG